MWRAALTRLLEAQGGDGVDVGGAAGGDRAGDGGGRVEKFRRDGWARPWPVGAEMLCYMIAHEAHHRGQVCMLASQLGFPLPKEVAWGMWNWEKLWKERGARGGVRS